MKIIFFPYTLLHSFSSSSCIQAISVASLQVVSATSSKKPCPSVSGLKVTFSRLHVSMLDRAKHPELKP